MEIKNAIPNAVLQFHNGIFKRYAINGYAHYSETVTTWILIIALENFT